MLAAQELQGVVDCRHLIIPGAHTHYAPDNFFGNAFYDLMAQNHLAAPKEHRGFQQQLTEGFTRSVAQAVREAKDSAGSAGCAARANTWR